MNIGSLSTKNIQIIQRQRERQIQVVEVELPRQVVPIKRIKLSKMFDISTAKSGCKSCGGG